MRISDWSSDVCSSDLALSTISIGNGFFKPNTSTTVGVLYEKGDRRRDSGFTIFYMGINCGSIGGQLVCPIFADLFGWWAGFLVGLGRATCRERVCRYV